MTATLCRRSSPASSAEGAHHVDVDGAALLSSPTGLARLALKSALHLTIRFSYGDAAPTSSSLSS